MTKRKGATSDNVFIFRKINENENIKEKKQFCNYLDLLDQIFD